MKYCILALLAVAPALSGTTVQADPNRATLRFVLDPKPSDKEVTPITLKAQRDGDIYAVPVKEFLYSIFHLDADSRHLLKVESDSKKENILVLREGKKWVSIPIDNGKPKEGDQRNALVYEPPGVSKPSATIRLNRLPYPINARYFMSVDQLAPLFGASTEYTGTRLVVRSGEYWASELLGGNLPRARYWPQLSYIPRFGISPVVNDELRAWVKVRRPSYLQLYSTLGGNMALIGKNGRDLTNDRFGVEQAAELKVGDSFVHSTTYSSREGSATVIAVLTEKRLDPDPRKHISSDPSLKYSIIGLRQKLGENTLSYRWVKPEAGEQAGTMAKRLKIEQSLFQALNGLDQGERLNPARSYLTFELPAQSTSKSERSDLSGGELYYVRRTDTLESLSSLWGVSVEDILEFNGIDEDEFGEGALISKVARVASGVGSSRRAFQSWVGRITQKTRAVAKIDQTHPNVVLNQNQSVRVVGTLNDNGIEFCVAELDGPVSSSNQHPGPWLIRSSHVEQRSEDVASGGLTKGPMIVKEALKYLGTRYVWGGNSLENGIDCSHFVKQVYNAVNEPCPAAPVINQEDYGNIVHLDPYRRYFVYKNIRKSREQIPMPKDRALTNWSNLRLGDRLIYQWRENESPGSRHTAIYAGSIKYPRSMIHAISKGVSLTPVWKRGYAYTVRGSARR